jgi:hypothetical protein
MHIVKKLMILVIVVASFAIIYKLVQENTIMRNQMAEMKYETFQTEIQKESTELLENAKTQGLELTVKPLSEKSKQLDFPLRDFMIKSSYNSAIIEKTSSREAIEFVIGRGCRLLDFEIYTRDTKEYVSDSNDPEYRDLQTGLTLSFEQAMTAIAANAFSSPAPAPTDPLFIHLRIKNHSKAAYKRISKIIRDVFGNKLYMGSVNGSTPIRQLIGKVVIIVDAMSAPDYYRYSKCSETELNCVPLTDLVNLVSGTVELPKYSFTNYSDLAHTQISVDFNTDQTNVKTFLMATPPEIGGDLVSFPNKTALLQLPVQMLLVPFYRQNEDLKKYEEIFNECGSSFCALGPMIRASYQNNAER